MIRLSNGHVITYKVAAGALGFDCLGWFWERPLVWLGLIKPELFTLTTKSLTLQPTEGNLCWWKPWTWLPFSPWSCVRFIDDGAVNKVGLTNKGFAWWYNKILPKLNLRKYKIVVSLFGTKEELIQMVRDLNPFNFVAYEFNVSCVNSPHALEETKEIIETVKAVRTIAHCRHPIILKLSVSQDFVTIAHGLKDDIAAIDFNSVAWEVAFPGTRSPLWRLVAKLVKKLGDKANKGGGGVSGVPAQVHNWEAARKLVIQRTVPVIASSIMDYEDLIGVEKLGVDAFSFGTIHMRTPSKATKIVERHMRSKKITVLKKPDIEYYANK